MPEAIYAAPGDAAIVDVDTMGKIPRKIEFAVLYLEIDRNSAQSNNIAYFRKS